jgi:DNA mismatch endonuclease (patch repair protein)
MSDVFTKAKRSEVMSRIRGSGNKDTELRLMAFFQAHGIRRWRRRQAIFGKPDFVFRKERVAVFVDGCFWHGCPKPKHSPLPKGNADFWFKKLSSNRRRDQVVTRTLRTQGWTVVRIWEHDLTGKNINRSVSRIQRALRIMPHSLKSAKEPDVSPRRKTGQS